MFSLDGASVPRWFDVTRGLPGNTVSTITVFGNPAVWWVGFVAMIALALHAIQGSTDTQQPTRKILNQRGSSRLGQISLIHSGRLCVCLAPLRLHRHEQHTSTTSTAPSPCYASH